jgi:hypothetical protein
MDTLLMKEKSADRFLGVHSFCRKLPALRGYLLFGKTDKVPDRHIRPGPYAGRPQMGQSDRRNGVITVQKKQKSARAGHNASITGVGQASVFLMDHPHTGILPGKFIAQFPASVRRTVIHKNDLQISEGLRENRFRAHLQIWFYVIDRDDHRD